MKLTPAIKIKSILNLYELLPENKRIITDVLRQIIIENLPANCKEKISFSVPFGVPFGNFFGWQRVVFFYLSISRIIKRTFLHQTKAKTLKFAVVPLISVLLSQVLLYVMLMYLDVFFYDQFGITALHRFVTFLIALIIITVWGIRSRKAIDMPLPAISWMIPFWFHLFFFSWLFIGGFYRENVWLVVAATINVLLGISTHITGIEKVQVKTIGNNP